MGIERKDLVRTTPITATAHSTAASASAELLDGAAIVGLVCPAAVGASVTTVSPQVSFDDGTTWSDVYDEAGTQLQWAVANGIYVDLYNGGNILPRVDKIRLVVDNANGDDTSYTIIAAVI